MESGVWSLEWEILDTHGYMGTWLLEGINTDEYLPMCASEVKKRCTCKDALQVSKHVDTGRNKTKRREKEEDETKFQ